MGFLRFLQRVLVPLIGVACCVGIIGWGIPSGWTDSNTTLESLALTMLLIGFVALIVIIVLLIQGAVKVVYRGALPVFMGIIALVAMFAMFSMIEKAAQGEYSGPEAFGWMNFYQIMWLVGCLIFAEALWIALALVIQQLKGAAGGALIVGGVLIVLALVVTFLYWLAMLIAYFFSHYHKQFLIVFGIVMGVIYAVFLILYGVLKRAKLKAFLEDNLDKHWRKAI